jgi:uncharacterized protein YceK
MRSDPYDCTGLSVFYAFLDLPFSVMFDTALLPLALLMDALCLPAPTPEDRPSSP